MTHDDELVAAANALSPGKVSRASLHSNPPRASLHSNPPQHTD